MLSLRRVAFSIALSVFFLCWTSIAFALTASVKTDGALVYAKPDFDAEILSSLPFGQKIVISKGKAGTVAKFYRMRAGKVVGFISDIDVTVTAGSGDEADSSSAGRSRKRAKNKTKKSKSLSSKSRSDSSSAKANQASQKSEAKQKQIEEQQRQARAALPFVFNRYVGLVVGLAGYEESIAGAKKKESLLVYGLKATGPDLFFQGPILDLNLLLHYGAPKGYTEISSVKPTGFFVLADTLLLLPMLQREKFLGTLGFGPNVSYRSYKTVSTTGFVNHGGFGVGLSLQASAGLRLGDYALRLEGKYLVDKRIDTIFQLSLQNAF